LVYIFTLFPEKYFIDGKVRINENKIESQLFMFDNFDVVFAL